MEDKEIAKTILTQMGGNRFLAMIGGKPIVIENGLGVRFPKAQDSINYVQIRLNSMDTYDMTFIRLRVDKSTVIKTYKNVYYDQLQDLFTKTTGLYTRL